MTDEYADDEEESVVCEKCGSTNTITNSRLERKQASLLCLDCKHITVVDKELYLKVLKTFKIKENFENYEGDDLK